MKKFLLLLSFIFIVSSLAVIAEEAAQAPDASKIQGMITGATVLDGGMTKQKVYVFNLQAQKKQNKHLFIFSTDYMKGKLKMQNPVLAYAAALPGITIPPILDMQILDKIKFELQYAYDLGNNLGLLSITSWGYDRMSDIDEKKTQLIGLGKWFVQKENALFFFGVGAVYTDIDRINWRNAGDLLNPIAQLKCNNNHCW